MTDLKRSLTLYSLTMVAIGSCIGSGIFLTPAQIARDLPSPTLILLVWGLGGVITLTGALTYGELGTLFPEAGGVYVYLREGYGNLIAFLYGWANLLVINTGAIAALSVAFTDYLSFIVPMSPLVKQLVGIAAIIGLTVLNIRGVDFGKMFSDVFTGAKLLGIICVIAIGLWAFQVPTDWTIPQALPSESGLVSAFLLGLVGVLWSYGGWQHASFLAGEARNPSRNVPRAMMFGAAIVTVVYVLTNLAYLFLLPVDTIANSAGVAAEAVSVIIPFGGVAIAILIAVSVFGTAGIYTLSSPRIYFAMARDGVFFERLAKIHPTFRTPAYAIGLQSVWAIILLLFWGTFANLISYVVFIDWIFFVLTAITIFLFRRRHPDKPRAYKTWGYPVVPLVFIIISAAFVINTLIELPEQAGAGLLFMGIGVLVYYGFAKNRSAAKNPTD